MKPYRLRVKTIITVSSIISLIVFSAVLLIWHKADANKIGEILIHYGLIILPISILWWLVEKYGWHWKIFQSSRNILNIPPDFRGRWEGNLKRDNEDYEYQFVIEIRQTLSKIWVYSYMLINPSPSQISTSQSRIAEVGCDDSEEIFALCFFWQGDGGTVLQNNISKGIHDGYCMLYLFEKENPKKLIGTYFTNREPQTKGKINLQLTSHELKKRF